MQELQQERLAKGTCQSELSLLDQAGVTGVSHQTTFYGTSVNFTCKSTRFQLLFGKGYPAEPPRLSMLGSDATLADGRDLLQAVLGQWTEHSNLLSLLQTLQQWTPAPSEAGVFHLASPYDCDIWNHPQMGVFTCVEIDPLNPRFRKDRALVVTLTKLLQLQLHPQVERLGYLVCEASFTALAGVKRGDEGKLILEWKPMNNYPALFQHFIMPHSQRFIDLLVENMNAVGITVKKGLKSSAIVEEEVNAESIQKVDILTIVREISRIEETLYANLNADTVNALMKLYQQAVEYYSAINDPQFDTYLQKMQNLMRNEVVLKSCGPETETEVTSSNPGKEPSLSTDATYPDGLPDAELAKSDSPPPNGADNHEDVHQESNEEPDQERDQEVDRYIHAEAHEELKEEVQEELNEDAQEELHEELHEEVQEEVQEETREEAQEETQEEAQEESQEEVQEEAQEESQEEAQEEAQEEPNEEAHEQTYEDSHEEAHEETHEEEDHKDLNEEARVIFHERPYEEGQEECNKELTYKETDITAAVEEEKAEVVEDTDAGTSQHDPTQTDEVTHQAVADSPHPTDTNEIGEGASVENAEKPEDSPLIALPEEEPNQQTHEEQESTVEQPPYIEEEKESETTEEISEETPQQDTTAPVMTDSYDQVAEISAEITEDAPESAEPEEIEETKEASEEHTEKTNQEDQEAEETLQDGKQENSGEEEKELEEVQQDSDDPLNADTTSNDHKTEDVTNPSTGLLDEPPIESISKPEPTDLSEEYQEEGKDSDQGEHNTEVSNQELLPTEALANPDEKENPTFVDSAQEIGDDLPERV